MMNGYKDIEHNKRSLSGYMTMEASFIVAWTFFIIAWIIYLGFFQYNRALIFQDNYMLAAQTQSYIATDTDKQNWLNGHTSGRVKDKYVAVDGLSINGNVSSGHIELSSSLSVKHWKVTDLVRIENYSFTKRLRTFRTVGRVLERD